DFDIQSANDLATHDAAVVALREILGESGQVLVVGVSLTSRGPVVYTTKQAGLESSHQLDYPAPFKDLMAALYLEDKLAVVRS
ncbi:hypothetical protein, partial [Streptococcus pyogenes]|uniref:hypothetical protein n=1 Tax=Streptococcus pyogenes TaxID=1314 RepID=UPI003DA06BA8